MSASSAPHARLAALASQLELSRLAVWFSGATEIGPSLQIPGRSKLALVPAQLADLNAYVTQRHYLHSGRTMAQVGYWIMLDPPVLLPGASAQKAPLGERWTLNGAPIAGAILYAYPRVSKRLYGFHPMEVLELARVYLEPGPDGRNPKGLASRAVGASLRVVVRDWVEAYPELPEPRAIVSWADSVRHTGTIYEALGFVKLGLTRGGAKRTRKGGPERADLVTPKMAYILPIRPPEPNANYALRLVLYGVTEEGVEEVCDLLSAEARAMGLVLPPRERRCYYAEGTGGEFILPLGPADLHGEDAEGAIPLADVARQLGDLFVEASYDADVTYEADGGGEMEWEIVRYVGTHYRRDRKTGAWGVQRHEETTMPVEHLEDNPRSRATFGRFVRDHGMPTLARWFEKQGTAWLTEELAGPRPAWLAGEIEGSGKLLPVQSYSDIGPQSGMEMRRWGARVFAVDPKGEYATTEVRPDEITGWPQFVKNVEAETSTVRLIEAAQRIRGAWVLTRGGRIARLDCILARVHELSRDQPMFAVFSSSGGEDDDARRENPTGMVRPGERVFVYRNLHKGAWSVRSVRTGLVVMHAETVYLRDTRFRVSEAGRQRILRERRKLVHAGIEGDVLAVNEPPPLDLPTWTRVTYDPYRYVTFVEAAHPERSVGTAARVYFDAAMHVFADQPIPLASADVPIRRNPGEPTEIVMDSEGRKYPARYEVVEVALDGHSTVMVSHDPTDLTRWTPGYPQAFQSRDLGSIEEQAKIRTIASKLDPIRLLAKNLDPTLGAPVVWEAPDGRLPALGGNGRILGFITAPEERYEAYLSMGRRLWPCFPTDDASPGHRWMLVRVVSGIDQTAATQLAAASQLSTAAEEGRLGKALSLLRSLQLKLEELPPFRWLDPLARDNMPDFWRANPGFVQSVLVAMDPAKRASYMNDADRLAPVVQAVMLAFLPAEARKPGVYDDPKVEEALFGALPAMITVRSMIQAGELYPEFDLLSALPDALAVFAFARRRRMSFKALKGYMEDERRTSRFGDVQRISDVGTLGMALAAALHNAARRAAPEVAVADILGAYVAKAAEHNPRQVGMFGAAAAPDAGLILARQVPGFALPGQAEPEAPGLLRLANPVTRRVARLIFDGTTFKPSDARTWCKRNRYHAGVPKVNAAGDVVIEQAGGASRRVVELDRGVTAAVAG